MIYGNILRIQVKLIESWELLTRYRKDIFRVLTSQEYTLINFPHVMGTIFYQMWVNSSEFQYNWISDHSSTLLLMVTCKC